MSAGAATRLKNWGGTRRTRLHGWAPQALDIDAYAASRGI